MPGKQPRCALADCRHECVDPRYAAPLVTIACTMVLFLPFLNSMGVTVNSGVSGPVTVTFLTVFIGLAWLVSILLGCLRRHENEVVCFWDSIGLPSLVTAGFYVLKGTF